MSEQQLLDQLNEAVRILRQGGVVAFPTETVYGLAADAHDAHAVERVFRMKGRPSDHPVIVHVTGVDDMTSWWKSPPPMALQLAETYWPGPLTLIAERQPDVLDAVTGGLDTVALRAPQHPIALRLITQFGSGLVGPSANRFGAVSPTTAEHVRIDFGDAVDLVLDGGPCDIGIESTVVDCTASPKVLRLGGISADQLALTLGEPVDDAAVTVDGGARSPGTLPSHYQPTARVVIVRTAADLDALRAGGRVGVLDPTGLLSSAGDVVRLVCPLNDNDALARVLYDRFRHADSLELDVLAVVLPDNVGIGPAIQDRVRRAAGVGDT